MAPTRECGPALCPACKADAIDVDPRRHSWKASYRDPSGRFHDLRHTGVALAIKAGAHPRTIQAWVGHSSITTTMDVYGHLYDEAHEELAAGLDTLRADALANREPVADVVALGG